MTADVSIHRLLDDAFEGVAMTPELQDLKEELRASLLARAEELQHGGADPAAAATTAMREIGDIDDLVAAVSSGDPFPASGHGATGPHAHPDLARAADIMRRQRVRPSAAFVVRTVLLAIVLTAAVVLLVLGGIGALVSPWGTGAAIAVVFAVATGVIVADALRQETTMHFALPRGRAAAWGLSAGALAAGLGLVAVAIVHPGGLGVLIAAIVLGLAGILGLVWCGVTQTNRTKPWVLAMGRQAAIGDRFADDPAAAARFGIYTVVVWIGGLAAFIVLSLTVGFVWSWLAIVATIIVFFLVLARMNFPAGDRSNRSERPAP
jgi:hypothetical protein